MESIIITFIYDQKESDLQISNQEKASVIAEELNEWLGHLYTWDNQPRDLEYSLNGDHWFKLSRDRRLAEADIWDGAYLRLSEEHDSKLPERQAADLVDDEPETAEEQTDGYVWQVLE